MRFDELERKMRVYETAHDLCALPGLHLVARMDGRGFTRLTKERLDLDKPFDARFRDAMEATATHLMQCGFRSVYAHVQSDEISLLLHRDDDTFARKLRKVSTVLAGEASACMSLALGAPAAFDARISQLPSRADVVDYFRWRHEDAHRNSLGAHCYWLLRGQGLDADAATRRLRGMSSTGKHDLLFAAGLDFNDLPAWQKRGSGLFWESVEVDGAGPEAETPSRCVRKRLRHERELPLGDAYGAMIAALVDGQRDGV